ncbi:MAG TPA: putative metallopeptidase [Candidatus Limnocylindria bacterium]|jgi:hypothetical protein|nr:putative metallopeptidase [Candidatus Limnocylindria bacterium]
MPARTDDRTETKRRRKSPAERAGENGHSANGESALRHTKPLRKGQRAKVRKAKKTRVLRDAVEATEVAERANKMIGADAWRLRSIVNVKTLFLFVHSENVGGGCLDGVIKTQRYPRLMRWKSGLKFEVLIVAAKPRWDRASDQEKTRYVFHALRHFWTDTNGAVRMQQHEISGFYAEVEFFGLRAPEIKKIAEQLDLVGHRTLTASEKS